MRIRRTSPAGAIVIAVLGLGWAGQRVQASGYALREQSASALGNAFAGATAGAEDVSYMFFNPAGLTRHSGSQIIGIPYHTAPDNPRCSRQYRRRRAHRWQ